MSPVCLNLGGRFFFFQLSWENVWTFWTTVDADASVAENYCFVLRLKGAKVKPRSAVPRLSSNPELCYRQRPPFCALKEVAAVDHARGDGLRRDQVGVLGDGLFLGDLVLDITVLSKTPDLPHH